MNYVLIFLYSLSLTALFAVGVFLCYAFMAVVVEMSIRAASLPRKWWNNITKKEGKC